MSLRWKDRIKVHVLTETRYDAWGHIQPTAYEDTLEYWAFVKPMLSTPKTAVVTVRQPFNHSREIHIEWQNKRWRLIQGPIAFSETRIVQFKMEELV